MTGIVNHDTGKLRWAGGGHGKAVLDQFFTQLTPGQRAGIQHITADGADSRKRGGMVPKRGKEHRPVSCGTVGSGSQALT
jgi:hypothetical protein